MYFGIDLSYPALLVSMLLIMMSTEGDAGRVVASLAGVFWRPLVARRVLVGVGLVSGQPQWPMGSGGAVRARRRKLGQRPAVVNSGLRQS